ncbi:MAG: retropepsin-like domain-containing protein [Anaerolineales bacterium]|nr:retropepsin-like domain-containing protein [Anaerolineales bacterium]
MDIALHDGLPFVSIQLTQKNQSIIIPNVLLDTGSAGTVFNTDLVAKIDVVLESDDIIRRIRGVGGSEFVFTKLVDEISLGELQISEFEIEVGAMAYGFEIGGIIGMDFLTKVGAIIDLKQLRVVTS